MPKGVPKKNGPFVVYSAINSKNGKQYIGVTAKSNFKKRRATHLRDATTGRFTSPIFHHAIVKYGFSSFEWSVLSEVEIREDALLEEIRLIAERKPAYNITRGGQGAGGFTRPLEHLESISRRVTCLTDGKTYPSGAAASREYGISGGRLSIICRKGGATKGLRFKFSDDEYAPVQVPRTAEAIAKHKSGVEAGRQKAIDKCRLPVACLDTGERFRSVIDAAAKFGCRPTTLYSALARNQKCMGRRFGFITDHADIARLYTSDQLSSSCHGARRVICLDDKMVFDSVAEASVGYGIHRTKLDSHLKGTRVTPHVNGKRFSYLDEWCPNPE